MSLTRQVLTRLTFSVTLIFIITASLFYFITFKSFEVIENNNLITDTLRARDTLLGRIEDINIKASDWANWDDTYNFLKNSNQEYITSNFVPFSFVGLNLNTALIFDGSHNLKASIFIDITSGESLPVPNDILETLTKTHPEIITFSAPNESHTGIIYTGGKPFLVASRSVSNSKSTLPVNGALIFGRYLDDHLIQEISSISHNQIKLSPLVSDSNLSPEISIRVFSSNSQQGSIIINDILNQPMLLLSVNKDRPIFNSAITTLGLFTLIFILSMIVIIFTNFRIIRSVILQPLSALIKTVDTIFTRQNYSVQIPPLKSTELTSLANTINSAFSALGRFRSEQEDKIANSEKTNHAMMNILEDERRLEIQIKKQRDEAQTLIQSMGEGLLVIDLSNTITTINPVAEKLLETTASDSIGKNWSELIQTAKGNTLTPTQERSFPQVVATGKTIITTLEDDHYYLTPSGNKFPVTSITAPIFNDGQIVGAIKIFKDATPEKEAKANIEKIVEERTRELQEKNIDLETAKRQVSDGWLQIQQEKAKLTASLNNLPLGFIISDIDGNVLLSNPAVNRIFGSDISPQTLALADNLWNIDLSTPHTSCVSTRQLIELKDLPYNTQILRILVSPILVHTPSARDCIGSAILIEDVSEAKILERSRDEFFSIASHELRTPLTAIRGNTSMILQYFKDKLEPDVLNMIKDVEEASVRLISIVNDFLDVSRLEQGKIEFKKDQFDPVGLINHVINDFQTTTSQQKILLELDPACTSSPPVFADQDRTRQVLINLIGNAMKFSEGGKISISLCTKDKFVEICVTDTGRGIPLENQKLLFRKFQQAASSIYTRDTSKGTGLGLYVSKLITEGQGGNIYLVKSAPETGSVFAFTLPIWQNI